MINKIGKIIKEFCFNIAKIAKDKILHFSIAYIIFDFCLSIFNRYCNNIVTILYSLIVVSVFIIFKEILDKRSGEIFDTKDILAGYIGVCVKLIIFILYIL